MFLYAFFFSGTAPTEIYTLSLHDALPIFHRDGRGPGAGPRRDRDQLRHHRSEEHTSELQSHSDLVCRLLLEKKKDITLGPAAGVHDETTGTHGNHSTGQDFP